MSKIPEKLVNVVAGLLYQTGKLLVCQRRANGPFPLKWEFPGGKIEAGESDIEALERELREELAIDIRGATLVYRHTHSYAEGLVVSLRFYRVHGFHGDMKNLAFETTSWITLAELEHMDFLEGDRPMIRRLLSDPQTLLFPR